MGEWTSGTITIHCCPGRRVRAVAETLEEYWLMAEAAADVRRSVILGESCGLQDMRVGRASELAHALMECAPEVAFTVYEQPAYEWLGTVCSYVPELGLFTAKCNTSGDPMFAQSEVLQLDDAPGDERAMKLGVPWLIAIAAMPHRTVEEPERSVTHWDRRHGEVIVMDGKECGEDLLFATEATEATEVDAALGERGFERADEWAPLDETSLVWRAAVYRSSACA